jgi:hypothetical protein
MLLGAIAGALALVLVATFGPAIKIDLGAVGPIRGAYLSERADGRPFNWTGRDTSVELRGIDRRVTWSCAVLLRGLRPEGLASPLVTAAVDGVSRASIATTSAYEELRFDLPPQAGSGAVLTLSSSDTFQPSSSDRRILGVQVESWTCQPAGGVVVPPRPTLMSGIAAAGILGSALGLIGLPASQLAAAAVWLAGGQAMITRGFAAFRPSGIRPAWLALWTGVGLLAIALLLERLLRRRLTEPARFVVAFSAIAAYLKLLVLLHPAMPIADALFHAHRLESVLSGRFYFTQPLASGMSFPYAIGLYVFAAPWAAIARDHVLLLRVVVVVSEVLAGALLYPMVLRTSGDRLMGAASVALFNLVPVSFEVLAYGNLTNGFGRSVATIAVVAAATWLLPPRGIGQLAGLVMLSALALTSHVSTFALLLTTLGAIALFFRVAGDERTKASAPAIAIAAILAATVSVVLYYGHFGSVYGNVLRMSFELPRATTVDTPLDDSRRVIDGQASDRLVISPASEAVAARVSSAAALTVSGVGWPILVLAAVGTWSAWTRGRDRLLLVVSAWAVTYVAFVGLGIAAPVDPSNQRYAGEFVGRVVYATCPAAVLLGAQGGVWAWRQRPPLRLAALILGLAAFSVGAAAWLAWLN